MSKVIGTVTIIEGQGTPTRQENNNTPEHINVGDSIFENDVIRSNGVLIQIELIDGTLADMAGFQEMKFDKEVFDVVQYEQASTPTTEQDSSFVEDFFSIFEGEEEIDPEEVKPEDVEERAIGGESDEGSSFVILDRSDASTTPESGFDTVGIDSTFVSPPEEDLFPQEDPPGVVVNPLPDIESDLLGSLEGGPSDSNVLRFEVSLTKPSSTTVSVDVTTQSGTAESGVDFIPLSETITFLPGETSKIVEVQIIGDFIVEEDETVNLVLSNPQGVTLDPADSTATATIFNDDVVEAYVRAASGQIEYTFEGPNEQAEFLVGYNGELGPGMSTTITVQTFTGSDGTVILNMGDATDGVDYQSTTQTLTFVGGGPTEQSVFVNIIDDPDVEGPEVYHIEIVGVGPNVVIGAESSANGIIDDVELEDDSLSVGVSVSPDISFEGDTETVTFNLNLVGGPIGQGYVMTFDVAVANDPLIDATVPDDYQTDIITSLTAALQGVQGISISGNTITVDSTFTPQSIPFQVTVVDDNVIESVESIEVSVLNIQHTNNGNVFISQPSAETDIIDDDGDIEVSISRQIINDLSAPGSYAQFDVLPSGDEAFEENQPLIEHTIDVNLIAGQVVNSNTFGFNVTIETDLNSSDYVVSPFDSLVQATTGIQGLTVTPVGPGVFSFVFDETFSGSESIVFSTQILDDQIIDNDEILDIIISDFYIDQGTINGFDNGVGAPEVKTELDIIDHDNVVELRLTASPTSTSEDLAETVQFEAVIDFIGRPMTDGQIFAFEGVIQGDAEALTDYTPSIVDALVQAASTITGVDVYSQGPNSFQLVVNNSFNVIGQVDQIVIPFSVDVVNDDIVEYLESVDVTITPFDQDTINRPIASGGTDGENIFFGTASLPDGEAGFEIVDTDQVEFYVEGQPFVSEGGDLVWTVGYTGTLAPGVEATVDVDVYGGILVGQATEGIDFVDTPIQQLTFVGGGSLTQDIVVATIDDLLVEGIEEAYIQLSNPSANATISNADASGFIDDGIEGDYLTVNVNVSPLTSNEYQQQNVDFTLSFNGMPIGEQYTVQFELVVGGTANVVEDYQGAVLQALADNIIANNIAGISVDVNTGVVTLDSNFDLSDVDFAVAVVDDSIPELSETITVTAQNISHNNHGEVYVGSSVAEHTIDDFDNDIVWNTGLTIGGDVPAVYLQTVEENQEVFAVNVSAKVDENSAVQRGLTAGQIATVLLTFTGLPAGASLADDLALEDIIGTDLQWNIVGPDQVEIVLDNTSGAFTGQEDFVITAVFSVVNDQLVEGLETFNATLSQPTIINGTTSIANDSVTVDVIDLDREISLAISADIPVIYEAPDLQQGQTDTTTFSIDMTGGPLPTGNTVSAELKVTQNTTTVEADFTETLTQLNDFFNTQLGVQSQFAVDTFYLTFDHNFSGQLSWDTTAFNDIEIELLETLEFELLNATILHGPTPVVQPSVASVDVISEDQLIVNHCIAIPDSWEMTDTNDDWHVPPHFVAMELPHVESVPGVEVPLDTLIEIGAVTDFIIMVPGIPGDPYSPWIDVSAGGVITYEQWLNAYISNSPATEGDETVNGTTMTYTVLPIGQEGTVDITTTVPEFFSRTITVGNEDPNSKDVLNSGQTQSGSNTESLILTEQDAIFLGSGAEYGKIKFSTDFSEQPSSESPTYARTALGELSIVVQVVGLGTFSAVYEGNAWVGDGTQNTVDPWLPKDDNPFDGEQDGWFGNVMYSQMMLISYDTTNVDLLTDAVLPSDFDISLQDAIIAVGGLDAGAELVMAYIDPVGGNVQARYLTGEFTFTQDGYISDINGCEHDGNTIHGTSIGDAILGGTANDVIYPGGGNDVIDISQGGNDEIYYFLDGRDNGQDTVLGFSDVLGDDQDLIEFGVAAGPVTVTDDGTDTTLHFNGDNSVKLVGVTGADNAPTDPHTGGVYTDINQLINQGIVELDYYIPV